MTLSPPRYHVVTALAAALVLLASPARAEQAEVAALTAKGRALIYAGRLKDAEIELRKAAQAAGQSIASLYELARVSFAQDDYRKARAACKPLLEKDEKATLSQVCMARAFLVWRRASRAQEHLGAARAQEPDHVEVLLADADSKRMSGELDASLAAYQRVLELAPHNADADFGLGELYLVKPDLHAARRAFGAALAKHPQWPAASYELGKLSQGPVAIGLLGKVVAARPDFVDAKLALGTALLDDGQLAQAEATFRGVLKRDRKNALAHARLGMALLAKGELPAAETELGVGLAGLPNDAGARLALARLYARTERIEDAFEQFQQAAGLERSSPHALLEAGALAMKLSRFSLAEAFLQKAVERAPKLAAAQARYADALLARGDKAKAKEHYKLALAGEGELDRADVQRRLDGAK